MQSRQENETKVQIQIDYSKGYYIEYSICVCDWFQVSQNLSVYISYIIRKLLIKFPIFPTSLLGLPNFEFEYSRYRVSVCNVTFHLFM